MNFQQLRSVREAVRRGFNLTVVAEVLHTSQPGVSRQIRELEEELGIEIFIRAGKRLTGLTLPGQVAHTIIEKLLLQAENLKRAGEEYSAEGRGTLSIAVTHSQARYALPPVVRDFSASHPQVTLHLQQGSPREIERMLLEGRADIGIATDVGVQVGDLVSLPCYRWTHCVVVPGEHALASEDRAGIELTLARLAQFPIVTYEPGYTGRSHIDAALRAAGIELHIVLAAMDADVIKTYVELGLGVGIVAAIALDNERGLGLHAIDARHLFASNTTRLAVKRGSFLRGYAYDFIRSFAPPLTREAVERAINEAPAAAQGGAEA